MSTRLLLTRALCISGLASTPAAIAAQVAVTTHGVNLRPNHSSHNTPLRAIEEGDTLTMLSSDTTNGYVHVQTRDDNTQGWLFNRYVTVVGATPVVASDATTTTLPATSTGGSVTTASASYHSCPNKGRNNSGNTPRADVSALNVLKNRFTAPADADIDGAITLDALLAPGDDSERFDQSKAAEIVGVVTDVQVGGKETTNCEATDPLYRDTHIRIAQTAQAPEIQRVVIEVTPRWRAAMAAAGTDWTTQTLAQSLVGKKVRVRGWMLYDREHAAESENINPGGQKNWRATVWEIHPITVLEVVP